MTYRDDRARLEDIMHAIEDIERYQKRGRTECQQDELIRTWLTYQIQIIGEAASKVSEQLRAEHPEVPWRQIVAMRHILVHDYFDTDFGEVWNVVTTDLPGLKKNVTRIIHPER